MLKIKDKNYFVLLFFWISVQSILLFTYGIRTDGEAESILENANKFMVSGHFESPRVYLYFTEIFLVLVKMKAGLGNGFVIAIHLVLNLFALFFIYRLAVALYASKMLALIGGLLIIICWPYQVHNYYLSTESAFFSISTIYSCYLLQTKNFNLKRIAFLFLLLFIVCITRPSGLFFFASTIIYLFIKLSLKFSLLVRLAFFSVLALIGLFIINYFTSSGNGYDFIIPFKEEHIICGVSNLPNVVEGNMSAENSLAEFAIYLIQHRGQFFRLASLKSKAFFCLYRQYFSLSHNLFLIVYFYALYVLSIAAILKCKGVVRVEIKYFFAVICIYWLSVVFTCDDWGNRFFLTLTPAFVMIALNFFSKNKIDTSFRIFKNKKP